MAISDDDLAMCFSTDDLGTRAIFDTAQGELIVNGYFTEGSDAVEMYGVEIEAASPSFTCPAAEIAAVRRGNPVEIGERAFTAERIQRTGTRVAVVYLRR